MAGTGQVRVQPIDLLPAGSNDSVDQSSVVIVSASSTTRTFELIQRTLDKLHISGDPSQYQLHLGEGRVRSSWQLVEGHQFPLPLLSSAGSGCGLMLCRRVTLADQLHGYTATPTPDKATPTDVPDLCQLQDLDECSMLQTLQTRFTQGCIYTYIGSILISINPYYRYPIYNPKYSNDYQNRKIGDLPPHIFAIADDAYSSMLADKTNQSVIISGESGAGKTESTKFLLHQLMKLSSKLEETSSLELITLGTGPVLEAFGNAKTIANDNSSRFGKFILVKFKENGGYYGASIEKYLLEKTRIISQAPTERNYHVFYYLLNGADHTLKDKLHLLEPNEYHYLGGYSVVPLNGVDEGAEFQTMCESLEMLGFRKELQIRMFAVLSAILCIGNMQFDKTEGGDSVHIVNEATLDTVSELLMVTRGTLSESLTFKKSLIRGDTIVSPYKTHEAVATRDALSKALYGALFDWIVVKVNESLETGLTRLTGHRGKTIGVLDIFGFEVFQNNSFEQFCINFANEQLQHYFNRHIFQLEQEEYHSEGIEWDAVDFIDNTECLDLIAKKPTGLLLLLDEECSLSGNDSTLHDKFVSQHKRNPYYSSPRMRQVNPVFTVAHYASEVTYCIEGFLEKNRDLMRQDVLDVLATSRMDLVRALIGLPPYAVKRWHLAINTVLAVTYFGSTVRRRKERENESVSLSIQTTPTSSISGRDLGTPDNPIAVSGGGSSKGSSEAFPFEHSLPVRTKIGLRLTKVYDIATSVTTDDIDGRRRPSIVNLLRLRKQRPFKERAGFRGARHDRLTQSLSTSTPRLRLDDSGCGSSPNYRLTNQAGRRGQTKTVSGQFQLSLLSLMDQLECTNPYFVRCIKSNGGKAPQTFDPSLVTRQLRYTGIMETVRIRKSGFPLRMSFRDFYRKYEFLIGKEREDLTNQVREFLHQLGLKPPDVQLGHNKVFMRAPQKHWLDQYYWNTFVSKIVLIQQWLRAKLHRCKFLLMKRSVITIQAAVRGWLARKRFSALQRRLSAVVIIQSYWRATVCRHRYQQLRAAAVIIQAHWKGLMERRRFVVLVEEARLQVKTNRPKSEALSSISDEINAALMDFDKMLASEGGVVSPTHSVTGGDTTSTIISSDDQSSSSLSLHTSSLPVMYVTPSHTIKDIINQIQHSSASPSPPPSPRTTPTNNVKDLISKMQTRPTAVTPPTKTPPPKTTPTGNRLITDRMSVFLEEERKQTRTVAKKDPSAIKRIKSPFLSSDIQTPPSSLPPPSPLTPSILPPSPPPPPPFKHSMRRSLSHGDITNEQLKKATPTHSSLSDDSSDTLSHMTRSHDEGEVFVSMMQRSLLRRPLKRAGGPMERKCVTRRTTPPASLPPITDNHLSSEEELDVVLVEGEGQATPTQDEGRSKSTLPTHSQSLNEPHPRVQPQAVSRREIKSVGDHYEIGGVSEEPPLIEESSEFTMGVSVDSLYHLNYQLRHSMSIESSEDRSGDSSPAGGSDRFIIDKKRRGKKSPTKVLKGQRNPNPAHPLFSKMYRTGSPISSEESAGTPGTTPTAQYSPQKQLLKIRSKTVHSISPPSSTHSYKTTSVPRGQVCIVCNKTFSGFLKHGSKCNSCGLIVHKHCQDRTPVCELGPGQLVKRTSEKVVKTADDLDDLAQFLVEKHHMHSQQLALMNERQYRQIDRVFQMALSEFHVNLVSTYSLSLQEPDSSKENTSPNTVSLTFDQLVNKFNSIYRSMAKRENMLLDACDVSIGVNQIRAFLDEFVKSRQRSRTHSQGSKIRPKLLRRRKTDKDSNIKIHKNHRFKLTQFNLVTVCDQCSKSILVLQKGEVCEVCSYSCHENCVKKVNLKCVGKKWREANEVSNNSQFGVHLHRLQPLTDSNVPIALEKCLSCIESNGLYTQGIYRKSAGGTSKRAVREALEADPVGADLDNFSLYAVAATVTSFFRELPDPLLTKDLYTDFIRATEMTDPDEMLDTLHQIILKLPDINHDVFERLVFHLARIAQQHNVNKMDSHNLAIIFAPSLLQGHQGLDPHMLLSVMPKQTLVLEMIISEQMNKLTATIRGIQSISSEERMAASRLSKLMTEEERRERSPLRNVLLSPTMNGLEGQEQQWEERGIDIGGLFEGEVGVSVNEQEIDEEIKIEKELLTFKLENLQNERAVLTASLPKLEPYSPMEDECSIEYPLTYSSGLQYNRDTTAQGVGRDEFLKRQSMFASSKRQKRSSIDKRLSHDVPQLRDKSSSETMVTTTSNEDTSLFIISDMPSAEQLKPLTKNRISKPALAKRRKPTNHKHLQHTVGSSPPHTSTGSTVSTGSLTLFESPL